MRRGQVVEAEEARTAAQQHLAEVIDYLRQQYAATPEYVAAADALAQAEATFQSERDALIAVLNKNPQYPAAVKGFAEAQAQVEAARAAKPPDAARLSEWSPRLWKNRDTVKKLEDEAAKSSETYQTAKLALDDAQAALKALRDECEAELRQDPSYVAAQEAADQASASASQ